MDEFKAGDKIEHRPMPGFTMTVEGTEPCEESAPMRAIIRCLRRMCCDSAYCACPSGCRCGCDGCRCRW